MFACKLETQRGFCSYLRSLGILITTSNQLPIDILIYFKTIFVFSPGIFLFNFTGQSLSVCPKLHEELVLQNNHSKNGIVMGFTPSK